MRSERSDRSEERVRQVLRELGRDATAEDHELRALARKAAAEPRSQPANGRGFRRTRWAHPLRWVGAGAGVALVVGSGLGFSLGSSLTSPQVARAGFVGTGFLPARGWTVVQSGAVSPTGAATAVATNVALSPQDDPGETPQTTLETLPAHGIVVVATFTSRGDPGADTRFPVRKLPLDFADARLAPASDPLPLALDVTEYRVLAAVAGTNVDVRIYFRMSPPSAKIAAAAQRQLSRLVVSSERVTLFARPTVAGSAGVELFGSVDNGKAGETVTIQAKDCGSQFFRLVDGAETRDGGGWSTMFYPGVNTTLRAVWNDEASAQIAIQQRARVSLIQRRMGREYYVAAGGRKSFWRKRVLVQRRQGRVWKTVKTVVLTETSASKGYYSSRRAGAEFKISVPKGTFIRAVLPLSEARPCYLAGVSQTVRT